MSTMSESITGPVGIDHPDRVDENHRAGDDAQGVPLVKVFTLQTCRHCGLDFQPIDWLQWRAVGFCKAKCLDEWALLRSPDGLGR